MASGKTSSEKEEVLILLDIDHKDILEGHPLIPKMAWHAKPFKDVMGKGG